MIAQLARTVPDGGPFYIGSLEAVSQDLRQMRTPDVRFSNAVCLGVARERQSAKSNSLLDQGLLSLVLYLVNPASKLYRWAQLGIADDRLAPD
jgi:hypothetical protein